VVKAVDLLDALEHAAARGTGGDALVERHVAAFAAAHSPQVGTDCFGLLGGSPRQRALGTLAFLARLQTAYGPGAVPAIGKSLAPQLTALVDIFHSRTRRARLKGEIARLAAAGSLSELHWLLTASGEQALDVNQYAAAQREHAACEQALVKLRQEQHLRPQRADDIGGRAGVMTASLIAASIVIAAVMKVF